MYISVIIDQQILAMTAKMDAKKLVQSVKGLTLFQLIYLSDQQQWNIDSLQIFCARQKQ